MNRRAAAVMKTRPKKPKSEAQKVAEFHQEFGVAPANAQVNRSIV